MRSDFSVFMLADYDDFTGEFVENKRGDIHVCNGADDDISKIMAMDASFYQRGNIDRAPVSKPEASNEVRIIHFVMLPVCIPACLSLISLIQNCLRVTWVS